MKTFILKSAFTIIVATGVLLGGQWASAGNLAIEDGATTTAGRPAQQPSKPIVTEPATKPDPAAPAPRPDIRTVPATTPKPTVTAPAQRRPIQLKPRATPVLPATGTRSSSQPSGAAETVQQEVPGKKGTYRITLNGFKIFAQKGILPRRGHSYYIAAKVLKYSQWGAILSHQTKVTKVIGHTNKYPGAIKGGTATKKGGFRNGDSYPGSNPYAASGAYNDRLPLLVWEGVLEEGGDVVVVEPTIWEKRDGTDIFRFWRDRVPARITNLLACDSNNFDPNGHAYPVPQWTNQNPTPIDNLISSENALTGKRICLTVSPLETFRVSGRNKPDVIPGFTEKTFPDRSAGADPHGILFNYHKANIMTGENPTEPVAVVEYMKHPNDDVGFPSGFVARNQRVFTTLPVGGMQPFWFGSGAGVYFNSFQDHVEIWNSFSGEVTMPIIPMSTAIEMYLQIQQLPL